MTQLKSTGFRYVGILKETGLSLHKITDEQGGEIIEVAVTDGIRSQSVQLANSIVDELIADLSAMRGTDSASGSA